MKDERHDLGANPADGPGAQGTSPNDNVRAAFEEIVGLPSHEERARIKRVVTSIDADAVDENVVALAKVGLDAVIDEATGYQDVRPRDDLARRHEKYQESTA